jgi:hypothetical protein
VRETDPQTTEAATTAGRVIERLDREGGHTPAFRGIRRREEPVSWAAIFVRSAPVPRFREPTSVRPQSDPHPRSGRHASELRRRPIPIKMNHAVSALSGLSVPGVGAKGDWAGLGGSVQTTGNVN